MTIEKHRKKRRNIKKIQVKPQLFALENGAPAPPAQVDRWVGR
jgi:hypothetical protein